MYKSGRVIAFVVVFLLICSLPFIAAFGKAHGDDAQVYDLSVDQAHGDKTAQCVEPTEYMKASHMQLLQEWRDAVVRDGASEYVNGFGVLTEMSLDNTCLSCHSDHSKFCDSCHNYTGVTMDCWNCHGASDARSGNE
jgi:hypothetical protein